MPAVSPATHGNWLVHRQAFLGLLYLDEPQIVAEVLAHTSRDYAFDMAIGANAGSPGYACKA